MNNTTIQQDQLRLMLHKLGFAPHLAGYRILLAAIPLYADGSSQSVTKELYPALAKQFGYIRITGIERAIRYAIAEAWRSGDRAIWQELFPTSKKAPSNMLFLATLTEFPGQKEPLPGWEGE